MNRGELPTRNIAVEATTANPGTGWTTFTNIPVIGWCRLHNNTGTAIEYRINSAAVAVTIPDLTVRNVFGVNNMNEISVRRVDQSNSQVAVEAEALT